MSLWNWGSPIPRKKNWIRQPKKKVPSLEENNVSSYYPKEILSSSSQFFFMLLANEIFPFDTACILRTHLLAFII